MDFTFAVACFEALPTTTRSDASYYYFYGRACDGAGRLQQALDAFHLYDQAVPNQPAIAVLIGDLEYRIEKQAQELAKASALNRNKGLEEQKKLLRSYQEKYPGDDPQVAQEVAWVNAEIANKQARNDLTGKWTRLGSQLNLVQLGVSVTASFQTVSAEARGLGFEIGDTVFTGAATEIEIHGDVAVAFPKRGSYPCFRNGYEQQCWNTCEDHISSVALTLAISQNGRQMTGSRVAERLNYATCTFEFNGTENETWFRR